MNFSEWSNAKYGKQDEDKKKKKEQTFSEWSNAKYGIEDDDIYVSSNDDDDIAPVRGGDKDSIFKAGGFSDGVDSVGDFFGDLAETRRGKRCRKACRRRC